jgi:hypothetical protein
MKKKEVPQDEGLMEGRFEDVCYALDENGNYVAVLSKGWSPKNEAMLQAWDLIHEKVEKVRLDVLAGKVSPIAYYMEKNIMDIKLLADYIELPKRKVRKHLKPEKFDQLEDDILQRYAETFEINLEELKNYRNTLSRL